MIWKNVLKNIQHMPHSSDNNTFLLTIYLPVYLDTCLPTYLPTYPPTYLPTNLPAYPATWTEFFLPDTRSSNYVTFVPWNPGLYSNEKTIPAKHVLL